MEWLTHPWTIGLLAIAAVVAFAAAAFRHWSTRATAEYMVGSVLMLLAIRWSIEINGAAIYAATAAGVGTGLAVRAVDRGKAPKGASGKSED